MYVLPHTGIFTVYMVHAILILRFYGLYGSKRLAYSLLALLLISLGGEIYIADKLLPHFHAASIPVLGSICVGDPGNEFAMIW